MWLTKNIIINMVKKPVRETEKQSERKREGGQKERDRQTDRHNKERPFRKLSSYFSGNLLKILEQ